MTTLRAASSNLAVVVVVVVSIISLTPSAETQDSRNLGRRSDLGGVGPGRGRPCSLADFRCGTGECVSRAKLCNRIADCRDSSDESQCGRNQGFECEPNQFQCPDGKCIQNVWMCDGDEDCADGWDESNCPLPPPGSRCAYTDFECLTGGQCINYSYLTDEERDCKDGSDEDDGEKIEDCGEPRPTLIRVCPGEDVTINCKACGFPGPCISWRLNWGHTCITYAPERCTCDCPCARGRQRQTFGKIIIRNVQIRDQGAYTCEASNHREDILFFPDTILELKKPWECGGPPTPAPTTPKPTTTTTTTTTTEPTTPPQITCAPDEFNAHPLQDEPRPPPPICVKCYGFDRSYRPIGCSPSTLRVSKISLFESEFGGFLHEGNAVKVTQIPGRGWFDAVHCVLESDHFMVIPLYVIYAKSPPRIYIDEFYQSEKKKGYVTHESPFYWVLPKWFLGNRITSYGYYLKYQIKFSDSLSGGVNFVSTNQPDVIVQGKYRGGEKKLFWYAEMPRATPDTLLTYEARFIAEDIAPNPHRIEEGARLTGKWFVDRDSSIPASRRDIMNVLQNVERLWIRATYDSNIIYSSLLDVTLEEGILYSWGMESLPRATWVEQFSDCRRDFSGTSCEQPPV